eukprot:1142139-Pelagomonas_calceolata.AAC.3
MERRCPGVTAVVDTRRSTTPLTTFLCCVQSNTTKHVSMDIRLYLELPGHLGKVDPEASLYNVGGFVRRTTRNSGAAVLRL